VLREQKLPSESDWAIVVERSGHIFGESLSSLIKGTTVAAMSASVKRKSSEARTACQGFCEKLKDRLTKFGLDPTSANRFLTATATNALLEKINSSEADQVVSVLVAARIATSAPEMGECLRSASRLSGVIDGTNWEIFDAIGKLTDDRKIQAEQIRTAIGNALQVDENVTALGPVLKEAQLKAVRLLTDSRPPTPPGPDHGGGAPPVPPGTKPPQSKNRVVASESRTGLSVSDAESVLGELGKEVKKGRTVKLNISWIVEEGGASP
jgi:hypothetical protein